MDHIDEGNHVFHRRLRQDAVSQIEDVTIVFTSLIQDSFSLCSKRLLVCKQDHGIEIPHYRHIVTHALPALVESDTPVESDYIAAGFPHQLQQRRCARAEMNYRNPGHNVPDYVSR